MTTPVALSLLLLLSRAASDPCYDPGGRPRFCLPPVTQLVGKAAAPCSQTCALPAASPGPACNGSLTLDLDGSFLLTSVTLRFCTAGPPALVLSAAWAIGGPWKPLWRRPAWPGVLGGPKKVTFHSLPGPKTRIVASYLRVEFGGKAGLVTTGVRGRCQCHGHAAHCATRAQPPRCRCRHHTTGPGCESCRPSHRDWPWRPATPQHPHPCLRKSWVLLPILATIWLPGTACQHALAPCPKACRVFSSLQKCFSLLALAVCFGLVLFPCLPSMSDTRRNTQNPLSGTPPPDVTSGHIKAVLGRSYPRVWCGSWFGQGYTQTYFLTPGRHSTGDI